MKHYSSNDKVTIKGRGTAFYVDEPWDGSGKEFSPQSLVGQEVVLNGIVTKVKGVDMFMNYVNEDQPYRHTFGILV